MLSEEQGCAILQREFEARGFKVRVKSPFSEGGVTFNADGWDPAARVGYEFVTWDEDDETDLPQSSRDALARMTAAGQLYFLVVTQPQAMTEEELVAEAARFLDDVAKRKAR